MIKINVLVGNKSWKKYIKSPESYLKNKVRNLNTKINSFKKRKISDNEIIRSFCGTVKIPLEANNSKLNTIFEKILSSLCTLSGYDKIVREP